MNVRIYDRKMQLLTKVRNIPTLKEFLIEDVRTYFYPLTFYWEEERVSYICNNDDSMWYFCNLLEQYTNNYQ